MRAQQLLVIGGFLVLGVIVLFVSGIFDSEEPGAGQHQVETPGQGPAVENVPEGQAPPAVDLSGESVPFVPDENLPAGVRAGRAETEALILGKVTSPDGPVEGASIEIFRDRSPMPRQSQLGELLHQVVSDAEGQFRVKMALPVGNCVIQARHDQLSTARITGFQPADPAQRRPALKMLAGHAVDGMVFHQDGRPLEGARVRFFDLNVQAFEPENRLEKEAFADADGKFQAKGLLPGLKMVEAWFEGCATRIFATISIPREGAPLRFTLEDGYSIQGRVVYAGEPEPAEGARIVGRPSRAAAGARRDNSRPSVFSAVSDADGQFTIEGLTEGEFDLWAQGVGHLKGDTLKARSGAKDLVLSVPRPVTLEGRVLSKGDGAPLTEYKISAVANPAMVGIGRQTAVTIKDAEGKFRLEGIPAYRQLHLVVEAAGRPRATFGPITPKAGDVIKDLFVEVGRGALVYGSVIDSRGQPVPNAVVEAAHTPQASSNQANHPFFAPILESQKVRKRAKTDADGRFVFDGLAAGAWAFEVSLSNQSTPKPLELQLAEDEQRELEPLRLVSAGTIIVYVTTKAGEPDSAGSVRLLSPVDPTFKRELPTDSKGRCVFPGLIPGEYQAMVSKRENVHNMGVLFGALQSGANTAKGRIVLKGGETIEVTDP